MSSISMNETLTLSRTFLPFPSTPPLFALPLPQRLVRLSLPAALATGTDQFSRPQHPYFLSQLPL
jgi:hypothetical protein